MLWDHCKVSRSIILTASSVQFVAQHSSAPCTCSHDPWGDGETGYIWRTQNQCYALLHLAQAVVLTEMFFLVMLTQGILMSDEAGGPPHFPHRWASSRTGLRAPRVHCLELIMFSIKPWTTNRVTGLSSKIEKSIAHALAAGLVSGSSVDAQGCKLSRLPVC